MSAVVGLGCVELRNGRLYDQGIWGVYTSQEKAKNALTKEAVKLMEEEQISGWICDERIPISSWGGKTETVVLHFKKGEKTRTYILWTDSTSIQ